MKGLLIAVMFMTLAATAGFAQVRGGFRGGVPGRSPAVAGHGFVAPRPVYRGGFYGGGFYGGYGVGLGYAAPYYAPSCYGPYAYGCGYPYPAYGYAAPVVPRVVVPPVVVGGGWRHFRR
jgi:hypothetical protein